MIKLAARAVDLAMWSARPLYCRDSSQLTFNKRNEGR